MPLLYGSLIEVEAGAPAEVRTYSQLTNEIPTRYPSKYYHTRDARFSSNKVIRHFRQRTGNKLQRTADVHPMMKSRIPSYRLGNLQSQMLSLPSQECTYAVIEDPRHLMTALTGPEVGSLARYIRPQFTTFGRFALGAML